MLKEVLYAGLISLIKLFKPAVMTTPMWAISAAVDAAAQPDLSRVRIPGPSETDQSLSQSETEGSWLLLWLSETLLCHRRELPQTQFVVTKRVFCCDRITLVATKLLSRQTFLSQQNVCCNKHSFAATKMIPVAAPTHDISLRISMSWTAEHRPNIFVTTKRLLQQTQFCCSKNDPCGRSHPWYFSSYLHVMDCWTQTSPP